MIKDRKQRLGFHRRLIIMHPHHYASEFVTAKRNQHTAPHARNFAIQRICKRAIQRNRQSYVTKQWHGLLSRDYQNPSLFDFFDFANPL